MATAVPHTALSIAGSDPSGGAGIQADLKTFTSLGIFAGAAITCLTAQNTRGVASFKAVDAFYVKEQIEQVLIDLPISHIKIGMVGAPEIARAVSDILTGFRGEVLYDPVLTAGSGQPLVLPGGSGAIQEFLLPRVHVLTPNINELEILSGKTCRDEDSSLAGAASLLERYASLRAVVVKGGHLNEESDTVIDCMVRRGEKPEKPLISRAVHPRIKTAGLHGTGCTFASAFTAFHMLSKDYSGAFHKAVAYMDALISKSARFAIGHGKSPLFHHLLNIPPESKL